MSFKHQLFLIFFECPVFCPVSSFIITKSCLSSLSMPLTIFYRVTRSPHYLLSCRVGSIISFSLLVLLVLAPFLWLLLDIFLYLGSTPLLYIPISDVSYWLELFSSYPYTYNGKPLSFWLISCTLIQRVGLYTVLGTVYLVSLHPDLFSSLVLLITSCPIL